MITNIDMDEGMYNAIRELNEVNRQLNSAYYDEHYEDVSDPTSDHDVKLMSKRRKLDMLRHQALSSVGWHFMRLYGEKNLGF